MFPLARGLLRHKVGVVAVAAVAVVLFAGNGQDEDAAKPSSPWSSQQPSQVAATSSSKDDDSLTAKIGQAATAAGDIAAEKLLGDKDLNPIKLGEEATDNFSGANDAFKKANSGN
jgi:hypothetical protein